MMGVLPCYNRTRYNHGARVPLYSMYTWILLSAMSTLVCSINLCTDSPTGFLNGTTIPAMLGKPISVVFCVQCQSLLYISPYIKIQHPNHPTDPNFYYKSNKYEWRPIIVNITSNANKATINITIKAVRTEDFTDQFSVTINTNKSLADNLVFFFHLSTAVISDAEENQTLTNVTTDVSSYNSSRTAGDEATMGTTESIPNRVTIINITNTTEEFNNNQETDDTTTNQNTSTTYTTFDSSYQSAVSSNSMPLLSTTPTLPNEIGSSVQGRDVNRNNTTAEAITSTAAAEVTNISLDYGNKTPTVTEATDVTSNDDLSTTSYQNTSNSIGAVDRTKSGGLSKIKLLVMTVTAATAFFVVIFVIAIIVYFHGGRCRQTKRHTEEEYVDCDHELYTTLSVYTNFRHHGARAAYQPLNLKDDRLITKMEVDEVDDDNCTDNTIVDVEDTADSGRHLSPEGLIYVTVEHANGKTKASSNTQKDDNKVHYATVDIDKTNKLFTKLKKHENNKKKRKSECRKKR